MRILVWSHSQELDDQLTPLLVNGGNILFRESDPQSLLASARREEPALIALLPAAQSQGLTEPVRELASHPDTRWTPIVILGSGTESQGLVAELLENGVGTFICTEAPDTIVSAQLAALQRNALQLSALRSTRMTDEKTGFYHQAFLLDQLQVFCRKKRRDGVAFCLLFVELRGDEGEVRKIALNLNATVRGADLFGRWEDGLFAVLLPASQEAQARLLANRFESIVEPSGLQARAALVASENTTVESEALVEAALNTLDAAWQASEPFLWRWNGTSQVAVSL